MNVRSGVWAKGDGACVLSGQGFQQPFEKGPGSRGALCGMNQHAQEFLESPDRNRTGGQEVEAEEPGFFHFGWVDGHGETDGVEDYSDPGDEGGGAFTLVWSCVQAQLDDQVEEMLVMGPG